MLAGTLVAETAVAMHGVSQLSDKPTHTTKTNINCIAGFLISNDIETSEDPLVQKTNQNDSQESKRIATSNCHSSLQLFSSTDYTLFVPVKNVKYNNFVLLGSPQSFVFEIADPPRV